MLPHQHFAQQMAVLIDLSKSCFLGRGGGQVVSVLNFYSDDPSSNPADVYSFFFKICVWKERK